MIITLFNALRSMRTWLTPGNYARTVVPRYLMLSILTLLTSGLTKVPYIYQQFSLDVQRSILTFSHLFNSQSYHLHPLPLPIHSYHKASLNLVNYPTQVIFKSCKLVPVMILARLFAIGGTMNVQKEEYVAAVLLSTGKLFDSLRIDLTCRDI